MLPTILEGCLLKEHRDAGIELYEPDDHMLVLRYRGEVIATYSSTGAKVEEIIKDATGWLLDRQDEDLRLAQDVP